jgi:hypothetical protein
LRFHVLTKRDGRFIRCELNMPVFQGAAGQLLDLARTRRTVRKWPPAVLILATLVFSVAVYNSLPERMVIHSACGEPMDTVATFGACFRRDAWPVGSAGVAQGGSTKREHRKFATRTTSSSSPSLPSWACCTWVWLDPRLDVRFRWGVI